MNATTLVLLALAPASLLALAAPAASAEGCVLSEPTCYVTCPIEHLSDPAVHDCVLGRGDIVWFGDCPSGTYGPRVFVYQMEVTSCWH